MATYNVILVLLVKRCDVLDEVCKLGYALLRGVGQRRYACLSIWSASDSALNNTQHQTECALNQLHGKSRVVKESSHHQIRL